MHAMAESRKREWYVRTADGRVYGPADIASLVESFDNIFIRIEGVVRVGGTFFDQLLELSDAVLLMVGAGTTPRSSFAFARRHLKSSGKLVMAIAAGASAKRVRKDMEVLT